MKPDARAQLIGPCTKEFATGSLEERAWLEYYQNYTDYKCTADLIALLKFGLREADKIKKS